jgi:hypothetical protein
MSEQLQQFIIVAAFGGLCFGCGYLIAYVVTRNKWRDEMIKARRRPLQLDDRQMGMGRAAERIKILKCAPTASRRPGRSRSKPPIATRDAWLHGAGINPPAKFLGNKRGLRSSRGRL